MKRIIAVALLTAFVIMLAGCGSNESKKDVIDLVEKNYDAIVDACENRDAEALLAIEGITDVTVVEGYVLVYCRGAGIAPSSQDYGFYYSEENLPIAVDCSMCILCDTGDLIPEGNGYQYIEAGNVFYTEHIAGNIYFYSNAY